ncbi:hypothetical protein GCM10022206_75360 [Streptomyces chiangmaiensis]
MRWSLARGPLRRDARGHLASKADGRAAGPGRTADPAGTARTSGGAVETDGAAAAMIDADGTVVGWTPTAHRLLGSTGALAVGTVRSRSPSDDATLLLARTHSLPP